MPAHAVKGIIGAYDRPPEARVSRLDECRLKQKVGYGQDVDPLHYLELLLNLCHFELITHQTQTTRYHFRGSMKLSVEDLTCEKWVDDGGW